MHTVKNILIRITALALFAAVIAAVILWQKGVYEISFIKRPAVTSDMITESVEVTESTAGETDSGDVTSVQTEPASESVTDAPADIGETLDKILSLSEMQKKGYKVSEKAFDGSSDIARTADSYPAITAFSYHTEKVTRAQMVKNSSSGLYSQKNVSTVTDIPALRLYGGYRILDCGNVYALYGKSGKQLEKKFTGTPANVRSAGGSPVVKVGNKYYELNESKGLGNTVSADTLVSREIRFDSPSYYGDPGTVDLYPFKTTKDIYTPVDGETDEPEEDETEETEATVQTTAAETAAAETSAENPSEPQVNVMLNDGGLKVSVRKSDYAASGKVRIDGKYYTVSTQEVWGYENSKGEVIIKAQYGSAHQFSSNGLAAVTDLEGRLMYIDKTGKTVITLAQSEVVYPESLGNMRSRQSYREAVSDGIESLGMYYFDNGYVMIRRMLTGYAHKKNIYENYNILVSESGKVFSIPMGYELINYSDGILLLERDGKYGYMDTDGGWVQPAMYTKASPFVQGVASVCGEDGKCGLINTAGEYVLPMGFDYVSNASAGYVATYEEARGWEVYAIVRK